MVSHDDLLRGSRIPPLLMAPGLSDLQKAVTPKDVDDVAGSEPRRAAITQPSPRRASHFQAVRDRRAPDRVRWLLGCLRGLPPRFHRRKRSLGVPGRRLSSHRSPDHVPVHAERHSNCRWPQPTALRTGLPLWIPKTPYGLKIQALASSVRSIRSASSGACTIVT